MSDRGIMVCERCGRPVGHLSVVWSVEPILCSESCAIAVGDGRGW